MCNPIQAVSDAISSVGETISHALYVTGDTVDHALKVTGEAAEKDPIGTAAKAAALYYGGQYAMEYFATEAAAASATFAEGAAATSATVAAEGSALLPLEAATVTSWGPVANVTASAASTAGTAATAAGVLDSIVSGATSAANLAGKVFAVGNLVAPKPSAAANPFGNRVAVQPVYLPASQEGYATGGAKTVADYGRASDAAGVAAVAAEKNKRFGTVEIAGIAGVAFLLLWGLKK